MRQAGVAVQRRLDHLGAKAQRPADRVGGAGILVVVAARQARDGTQVDGAHLPALAPFRQKPLAHEHGPGCGVELLPRRDQDHPVIGRPLCELVGEVAAFGLVHTDDRTVWPTFGKEPPLGREIAPRPAMPVEMVGRQVGEDRHIGRERAGEVGLVGGQLEHHDLAIARGCDVEHAQPDIAGKLRRAACGGEDMVDQRRCGGFAVRPGDRDNARRGVEIVPLLRGEGAEKEANVIVHRHAGCPGSGDGRVRRGIEMRDAGGGDQQADAGVVLHAGEVTQGQPFGLRGGAPGCAVIPDHRQRPARTQGAQRGAARTAEAQDGDGLAVNSLHRDHHCPPRTVAWPGGRRGALPPGPAALPPGYLWPKDAERR